MAVVAASSLHGGAARPVSRMAFGSHANQDGAQWQPACPARGHAVARRARTGGRPFDSGRSVVARYPSLGVRRAGRQCLGAPPRRRRARARQGAPGGAMW